MILAVDVDYKKDRAKAAGVLFKNWTDSQPSNTIISNINEVEEYIPGEFYKRELPCILKLLKEHYVGPECILIDGYVYLEGESQPPAWVNICFRVKWNQNLSPLVAKLNFAMKLLKKLCFVLFLNPILLINSSQFLGQNLYNPL